MRFRASTIHNLWLRIPSHSSPGIENLTVLYSEEDEAVVVGKASDVTVTKEETAVPLALEMKEPDTDCETETKLEVGTIDVDVTTGAELVALNKLAVLVLVATAVVVGQTNTVTVSTVPEETGVAIDVVRVTTLMVVKSEEVAMVGTTIPVAVEVVTLLEAKLELETTTLVPVTLTEAETIPVAVVVTSLLNAEAEDLTKVDVTTDLSSEGNMEPSENEADDRGSVMVTISEVDVLGVVNVLVTTGSDKVVGWPLAVAVTVAQ